MPFWSCISIRPTNTLVTDYGTNDWRPAFFAGNTNYLEWDEATVTGALDVSEGTTGVSSCTMHTISWSAESAYPITFWVHEEGDTGSGVVQVNFNGEIINLTSVGSGALDILQRQCRSGTNTLSVIRDKSLDGVVVRGRLFWPEQWLDPRALDRWGTVLQ